jgi:aminomethyltransferase
MSAASDASPLALTPLNALHRELGARMVGFAGYDMPVNYPAGILAEHGHCRSAAGLFDVSHMGQISVSGAGAAAALESVLPIDVASLAVGKQRYGFFTNSAGGILDDMMITRRADDYLLVVNASNKAADLALLERDIGHRCHVRALPDRALLALQGPQAAAVLARLAPAAAGLTFMTGAPLQLLGLQCYATRSGYTGEDGYEISVPADGAEALARELLAQPEVKPVGLGARDTLRLEAGLCLHGADIDATTTPIEAGLIWAIQKVRRPGGERAGGYPGADVIGNQISQGAALRRVGLLGLERVPVRPHTALFDAHGSQTQSIGHVTSGTISPQLDMPIAMAYVSANHAVLNGEIHAEVRGKRLPMKVVTLPFVPHRYAR